MLSVIHFIFLEIEETGDACWASDEAQGGNGQKEEGGGHEATRREEGAQQTEHLPAAPEERPRQRGPRPRHVPVLRPQLQDRLAPHPDHARPGGWSPGRGLGSRGGLGHPARQPRGGGPAGQHEAEPGQAPRVPAVRGREAGGGVEWAGGTLNKHSIFCNLTKRLFIWRGINKHAPLSLFKIRSDLHKERGALPKQHPHKSGWHYSPCHTSVT